MAYVSMAVGDPFVGGITLRQVADAVAISSKCDSAPGTSFQPGSRA